MPIYHYVAQLWSWRCNSNATPTTQYEPNSSSLRPRKYKRCNKRRRAYILHVDAWQQEKKEGPLCARSVWCRLTFHTLQPSHGWTWSHCAVNDVSTFACVAHLTIILDDETDTNECVLCMHRMATQIKNDVECSQLELYAPDDKIWGQSSGFIPRGLLAFKTTLFCTGAY